LVYPHKLYSKQYIEKEISSFFETLSRMNEGLKANLANCSRLSIVVSRVLI
jgi:hypothetical protein